MVSKEAYTATYYLQLEDKNIGQDNVNNRFKNSYLSQLQYYLNQAWFKIVGVPIEIKVYNYNMQLADYVGNEQRTIKKFMMEDVYYIIDNEREHKKPVSKLQKSIEGGNWQLM